MTRSLARSVPALSAALGLATAASALTAVSGYDAAAPSQRGDFQVAPYEESSILTTVDAGHYEIVADPGGAPGDLAFQLDEQTPDGQGAVHSQVTITASHGLPFDALSLDVVNPAESAGEFTITAVGGPGSFPMPTATGDDVPFPAGFTGITALVITQHADGAIAIDDLVLPEPGALPGLLAGLLALAALRRRR